MPCEVMKNELHTVLQNFPRKIEYREIDLSVDPLAGELLDIQSTPALLFLQEGKIVDVIHGAVNREYLRNSILKFINL